MDDSVAPISAASAAGIFAEGSRFGAYVIGPCIGHGGMARIYRAEHQGLQRHVALKVLTSGVAAGTEGRARFVREARIAAAIKHPNVVNIFDVGVENGVPYLVMELLVGQDLESLLRANEALNEATIIDIIIPVVAGLVAVHDAGVVHRDLKPGNIFLSKGQNEEIEPKLLDFGISKSVGSDVLKLTAAQSLVMGTPLYMSPEALMGGDMTPLSDQYSLGVVLYECASGINPFVADNVGETVRRVTMGDYPPLSEQAIRPSKRLTSIIERAMHLDPAQRFPDMRALGQELLTLAGQRTQITWGLSFGQIALAERARQSHGLRPLGAAGLTVRLRQLQKRPKTAAAALGMAVAGAAAAWSLAAPRTSGPDRPTSAAALSGAGALPESVVRSLRPALAAPEASGLAPAAPAPVEPAPAPIVADAPSVEPVEPPAVAAARRARLGSAPARAPAAEPHPPRSPAPRRREAVAPRRPEARERPDWQIVPARSAEVERTRRALELGTNRAPILD